MNKNKEMFEKQDTSQNNQPPQSSGKSITTKDDYQVTLSLESDSNVLVGQEIYLKVTIKSTTDDITSLSNIGSVIIQDPTDKKSISYKTYKNYAVVISKNRADSYGEAILALTIHKSNKNNQLDLSISVRDKLKKTITGFNDRPVTYNVINNIPADSITLKTPHEFIATPTTVNPISDQNSTYRLYSGIISDNKTKPIGNIQVLIAAQKHNQLSPSSGLIEITNDPVAGAVEPMNILTLPDGRDFFVLTSNPQGEISFRAYPTAGAEGRVDFVAKIQNLTRDDYTAAICIYPAYSKNHPLDNPFINEMEEGGVLKKLPGQTDFTVSVNSYDGYMTPGSKDIIAFFTEYDGTTQKTLLSPTYRINNVDEIEDRVFSFPYVQLEPNKLGGIYYAIISEHNNIMYSESLNFKYVLDLDSPDGNNKGVYDKVTVYSTYADFPIKPSNRSGTVSESSAVIFDLISQGLVFGEGKDNSNSAGLYVLIEAAGTPTIKNLPQPNQSGKVRVSIKSSKGLVSKEYDFNLNNLKKDGTVKYQIVTIPFCFLKGILPIDGYDPSRLYIDYYIITDTGSGEKTYSKIWKVDINTMDPNEYDDDDYYGCSS
ncbi:hypothetical protein [Xenorhabdus taiwanensis]|uniref:Inverse autotransporter beta-barrel domain-containing protein n=1 Tax=Xenorhabdus taiwanensis TaxID=3085177 RepID=A0ABM8JWI9_9GAMM|nr:hypothetical protein TCT1_19920 [Xenorhabdus sp. TCT-1]